MRKIAKQQLREALEHLPPVQSRRIYARFMLHKTIRAVAEAEGVSATSVSGSIKAGLKSMKRYYDKHHWEVF